MMRGLRSTSARLSLAVAVAFLLAFLLLGSGVRYAVSALLLNDTREVIRADAAGLQQVYRQGGHAALRQEVDDRAAGPDDPDSAYALLDRDGRILAGSFSRLPPSAMRGRWVEFYEAGIGKSQRIVANRLVLGDGEVLLTGLRTRSQDRFMALVWRTALSALAVATLLSVLVGWMVTRWVSRRLRTLDRTAERVGAGEMALRAPTDGSDDAFDRLARRFNAMLDRIEELLAGVRHATDHIAHDLRTPLTRLRNRLEELRERPVDCSGDSLSAAIAETDQLLQSFAALLRLARIEAQPPVQDEPPIDLAAVVRDAVELYVPVATERGISLQSQVREVRIRGDSDQLFQMVVNVLDNAMKYAPCNSVVAVSLAPGRDGAFLEIADHGDGIPESECSRVFDRFQRLEQHRGSPGTGLGLSLVWAIVARHGGRIEICDNAPGLRVGILFPVVAATTA